MFFSCYELIAISIAANTANNAIMVVDTTAIAVGSIVSSTTPLSNAIALRTVIFKIVNAVICHTLKN